MSAFEPRNAATSSAATPIVMAGDDVCASCLCKCGHPSAPLWESAALDGLFHDEVTAVRHAERLVGLLRGRVLLLDVQAQPDDVAVLLRFIDHVLVQRAVHALSSEVGAHVD